MARGASGARSDGSSSSGTGNRGGRSSKCAGSCSCSAPAPAHAGTAAILPAGLGQPRKNDPRAVAASLQAGLESVSGVDGHIGRCYGLAHLRCVPTGTDVARRGPRMETRDARRETRDARRTLAARAAIAAILCAPNAFAGSYLETEAVNLYPPGQGNLANAPCDAQSFRSVMLGQSSVCSPNVVTGHNVAGFAAGGEFYNASVWTTDFVDRDKTGWSYDQDQIYFDKSDNAIAWYTGHGTCGTGDTEGTPYSKPCTSSAQCAAIPAGANCPVAISGPGFCGHWPANPNGKCAYTCMARQLYVGNPSSPSPNGGGRNGFLSYSTPYVKWGESGYSGGWAGAGYNGGVNMVVLHASCAELSNRGQEVRPAFAGMHLLANVLVHKGDAGIVADRGSTFATQYVTNPYSSVAHSWAISMNSISQGYAGYCTDSIAGPFTGTAYGGGFGVNGCGGHVVTAVGATASEATDHLAEDWYGITDDLKDAKGNAYWASEWNCNYDCVRYPFAN
ncbi:hypothetical protein BH11MYX4_BH11MYX4_33120 [soil metagenome]